MNKTKITRKGQVTIPKEIRGKLSLKESDILRVSEKNNMIIMEKMTPFLELKGSVKVPDEVKNLSWKEIEEKAHQNIAQEADKW
ncbi:MAG: AbrB/MazE/SpoVT family DNA-binding domain-containing protein [Actinobacteria bacterium]|jgi:AbrB family looped-hinge helix DNA binding protein|nr:AbrB/MazE/SpoVT family DNA-binding domain-containing protein [Cyanobacteriota bacterium]MCL5770728.1 AbrB/MazE/SpoVT family DNA-binding domain-containing protein [Actinomycetota bacterium]